MIRKLNHILVLLINTFCLFFLTSCSRYIIDGDFSYTHNDNKYYLMYLSEEGEYKEVLIMPNYYNGKEVVYKKTLYYDNSTFRLSKYTKKVYFINSNLFNDALTYKIYRNRNNVDTMFFTIGDKSCVKEMGGYNFHFYSYSGYVLNEMEDINYYLENNYKILYSLANVSYHYNYDDAPNDGIYWIDDYDGEKIAYIPENPKREGYTFEGWYKDNECTEAWDFDNDIIPSKQYENDDSENYNNGEDTYNYYARGKYYFEETKLYAKWVKLN